MQHAGSAQEDGAEVSRLADRLSAKALPPRRFHEEINPLIYLAEQLIQGRARASFALRIWGICELASEYTINYVWLDRGGAGAKDRASGERPSLERAWLLWYFGFGGGEGEGGTRREMAVFSGVCQALMKESGKSHTWQ